MIIRLENRPGITSFASVGGSAEKEGPLGNALDIFDMDEHFGMKTWEQAESEMQRRALSVAMKKGNFSDSDIGVIFAGDLMNQCVSSGYGLIGFDIPYVGLYGACSTCAEGIAMASMTVNAYTDRAAAVTSSHFCSAERQFRYPLEYASQRAPTAQRTVTGSGAFVIEKNKGTVRIEDVMLGTSVDSKINDINNMGAAMAVAASKTLCDYFFESGKDASDFDAIFSGDLGEEGRRLTIELAQSRGYVIGENYDDCGLIVYNRRLQDMHSGGSGCGCSALVLAAKILPDIINGEISDVLFMATGALMSTTSVQQGLSIPAIAHIIHLKREKKNGSCDK